MKKVAFFRQSTRVMVLLAAFLASNLAAADLDVTGNLTVDGTATVDGSIFGLGGGTNSASGADGAPGISLYYVDGAAGASFFKSLRTAGSWSWTHATTGSDVYQMVLDGGNALSLYNLDSTPVVAIKLDPEGTSFFGENLTLNGADNRAPNQTLTVGSSILTRGLGDARYVQLGSGTFGTSTTVTGTDGFAFGNGTLASGNYSLAGGQSAEATASVTTAIGFHTKATLEYATAFGYYSEAQGNASTALGSVTLALGNNSTAAGDHSFAQGQTQFVIGRYNVAQGDRYTWVDTDDLFIIGNGADADNRSNALVVKKNGNTLINGTLGTQGDISTAGGVVAAGPSQFDGPVRIAPQGDLSMGDFTATP